jgi:hypothetical protein
MFALVFAGVPHYSAGKSTPGAIGIILCVMLIIWVVGKLFSKE